MIQPLLLFLRANRQHLVAVALSSALINLFFLAMPLFTMLVYDKAMGNAIHDTLWALCLGMSLLLGQELLLRLARVQLVEHAGARWDMFLDERLCRGLLAAPLTDEIRPADLLSRYRDVGQARDVLGSQMMLALVDLPFVLVFLAALALLAGPLVWVPLGFSIGVVLLGMASQAMAARHQGPLATGQRTRLGHLIDLLATRDGVLSAASRARLKRGFGDAAAQVARQGARARWWMQVGQQITPVWLATSTVVLMAWGVLQVEAQALSVGGLIAANLLGSRFLAMACSVAPLAYKGKEFRLALQALAEAVNLSATPESVESDPPALAAEGLRLHEVRFQFPGAARPTLQSLTLNLPATGLVVVLGNSGAGKSSLLKLLAGLVVPESGRFQFGGRLMASAQDRRWMQQHVAYKAQDPRCLPGRVRDIVADWQASATDEAVLQALRLAGLGPQLDHNEISLNTAVQTNGEGLSGGQRQMLALATALFSPAPVLLLDEPTLGLDRAAQDCLMPNLARVAQTRLVLVSTHATELIRLAQRVLVLDQGRLVLDGPPDKLLPASPAKAGKTAAGAGTAGPHPLTSPREAVETLQ